MSRTNLFLLRKDFFEKSGIGLGKKKTHLYPFGCEQKPEGDKDASESGSRIGV